MKTINADTLKRRLSDNEVVLIDVLEEDTYNDSHIKGAINIPLKKIGTEAKQRFSKDENLVVYCSDEKCTASPTAAKKLQDMGFENVYDFEGGKKAWKNAGYPMS